MTKSLLLRTFRSSWTSMNDQGSSCIHNISRDYSKFFIMLRFYSYINIQTYSFKFYFKKKLFNSIIALLILNKMHLNIQNRIKIILIFIEVNLISSSKRYQRLKEYLETEKIFCSIKTLKQIVKNIFTLMAHFQIFNLQYDKSKNLTNQSARFRTSRSISL